MKSIILLSLLLISCESNDATGKINDLIGEWIVVSKEEISSGYIYSFPDSLNYSVRLKFGKDSIELHCHDRELGSGKYSVNDGALYVSPFTIIEPCAINGWVQLVHRSINFAMAYSLIDNELKIITNDKGEYHLYLEKLNPD